MRYVSTVVGLLFGFIVVGSVPGVAAETEAYSTWITGCKTYPEFCVPRCQRDALYCARQINGYLLTPPAGYILPRFKMWPLYPGKAPARVNNSTPMHGSYLTIFVNETAWRYIDQLQSQPRAVNTVDFPNGSIIAKLNSAKMDMSNPNGPWLTVMFKLDGYCRADFGGTGSCVGGDWFYYLYRKGDFHYFDKVRALGKARPFCIDCHDPVQKGDFLWTTFSDLLKAQRKAQPTILVAPEQKADVNVANDCVGLPIGSVVPGDVATNPASLSPEKAQLMFDCLSWRSFVALNWPAQGEAAQRITEEGPRVWETYRSVFETFQPDDPKWKLQDRSWDDPKSFDPVCDQKLTSDKVLRMTGKQRYSSIVDESHQAFGNQFNILVDQNGKLTRFEVRLNRDEFEYLKANDFADTGSYDVGGPKKLLNWQAAPLQFPDNIRGFTKTGAIEIKAAWREMCTDPDPAKCPKLDDPTRYYTRDATIYTRDPLGGEATCRTAKVGLVGFHIAHKTFWAPQWVWSTFEHVDNVPSAGLFPKDTERSTVYSFYSPWMQQFVPKVEECKLQRPGVMVQMPANPPAGSTTPAACPNLQNIKNSHPTFVSPTDSGAMVAVLSPSPNQVTRLDKMTLSPLNHAYRTKLATTKGLSVFQYYVLINTQWPLNGRGTPLATTINMNPCPDDGGCYTVAPKGLRLRNTALETYQVSYHMMANVEPGTGQASSAGCMQCHGPSGLDFSFVWTDAVTAPVPLKQDDLSLPPPGSYQQSCSGARMVGIDLVASCPNVAGTFTSWTLPNAHSCGGDIANINGKLLCNPTVDSFTVTCNRIAVAEDELAAWCLMQDSETYKYSKLNVAGYRGSLISNCNGVLTKGQCPF